MGLDATAVRSEQRPPRADVAGSGNTRRRRIVDRLRGAQETLQAAYRRLVEASDDSIAAEWLLDNYYIVERAFRLVREEFPSEFERRLPQVLPETSRDTARVCARGQRRGPRPRTRGTRHPDPSGQ